jgi:hypothetical protein
MTTPSSIETLLSQARTVMDDLNRRVQIAQDIVHEEELPSEPSPDLVGRLGHRAIRLAQFQVKFETILTACWRASEQLYNSKAISSIKTATLVATSYFGICNEAGKANRLWLELPDSKLITCCNQPPRAGGGFQNPGTPVLTCCFLVNGPSSSEFQLDRSDVRKIFQIPFGIVADPTSRSVCRIADVEREGSALVECINRRGTVNFEAFYLDQNQRATLRKDALLVKTLAEAMLPTVQTVAAFQWRSFIRDQLPKTTIPEVEKTLCELTHCAKWQLEFSRHENYYLTAKREDENDLVFAAKQLNEVGVDFLSNEQELSLRNPDPLELRLQALLHLVTQYAGWRLTTSNRGLQTLSAPEQSELRNRLVLCSIAHTEAHGMVQLDHPDPDAIGNAYKKQLLQEVDSRMTALARTWPTHCSRIICSYLQPRYA